MSDSKLVDHSDQIAVIGMAGRFPGAGDLNQYWQNLRNGVESISFFSDEELLAAGIDPSFLKDPAYVRAAGVLEGIDQFDADFFGFNPREAEIADPQQRIFLECAWQAMENAGYDSESYDGAVGVFAGVGINTYWLNIFANSDLVSAVGGTQAVISNDKDYLSTLVSYKLNLKGPSLTVQTACSTSLVAVHLACQSLLNGECDMALAGGSKINIKVEGYHYREGGIASPDGHCRAFDAQAQGCMGGSGAGIIVLKRLADAIAHGDLIHAVIRGSAINNDGSMKVGFTAPSARGQAEVISEALAVAQVQPETITYIETHGTGTILGDPIEIKALTQAFRAGTQKKGYCAIASVKTNIGHLDAAAGIASLIKTVLALKHRQLPPSLHFTEPNPLLDLDNSPFFVNAKLADWNANGSPLRAGVSSFGIGGTNAHIVLQEAPRLSSSPSRRRSHLLLLSARSAPALELATERLREHLQQRPQLELADVAHTLQVGRRHFAHRRLLRCSSLDEAVQLLASPQQRPVITSYCEAGHRTVAFMFAGQGTQHVNMGRQLYEREPHFREQIDRCAEMLKQELGLDLRTVLYPPPVDEPASQLLLRQTRLAQPALFIVEYALARLLMRYGVKPKAMIGHSLGEYVAACMSGIFTLEQGLRLVAQRGRLMQELEGGAMTAVALGEAALRRMLPEEVSLAADNSAQQCVISGRVGAIEAVEAELAIQGVEYKRLETSHAFHSVMMDPMMVPYEACARAVEKKSPRIAMISSVTGQWLSEEEAVDAAYWTRQIREPVRFREGVEELTKQQGLVLVEIGVGEELSRLVRRQARGQEVFSVMGGSEQKGEVEAVEDAVGRLWKSGVVVKWGKNYEGERRQRVELPTYPFERKRYWLEDQRPGDRTDRNESALSRKADIADWFYAPIWKQSRWPLITRHADDDPSHSSRLIFVDESPLCSALVERLRQDDRQVICVEKGEKFSELSPDRYAINPGHASDYEMLLASLYARRIFPYRIIHLWNLASGGCELAVSGDGFSKTAFDAAQQSGFFSLLLLAQALNAPQPATIRNELLTFGQQHIEVVTANLHQITGDEALRPNQATVLGACKVIPQEYPQIFCRSIDILADGSTNSMEQQRLVEQLMTEFTSQTTESTVAYRGAHRWVQRFEPLRLSGSGTDNQRLRPQGVYLITGGLGRIGLELALYLAQSVQANLVLVGRSSLEETAAAGVDVSARLDKLRRIEEFATQVQIVQADVTDEIQMRSVIDDVFQQFGALHGVIHAAGLTGENSIQLIQHADQSECERQFGAKVYGAMVLRKVLAEHEGIEFCVLFSSIASVLGGLGFAAYAGANQYLDVLAQEQHRRGQTGWLSINWEGWNFAEQDDPLAASRQGGGLGASVALLAIKPGEGVEAFRRVLMLQGLPQILVSSADLERRIRMWSNPGAGADEEAVKASLHDRPEISSSYAAPSTAPERQMVDVWERLLGVEGIGIDDNFFELGGHSLLATQVVSRIRTELRVEVALRSIFEEPTVRGLVKRIEQQTEAGTVATGAEVERGQIKRVSRAEPLPLSYAQQRLWFVDQLEPNSTVYNLPIGLRMAGHLDVEVLEQSLSELVRRHEVLRTSFGSVEGKPFQIIREPEQVKLPVIDLDSQEGPEREEELGRIVKQEALEPFDLKGELLRLKLVNLGEEEHVLLVTMHHIISDDWSLGVLSREATVLYEAFSKGEPSPLPELEIQYADYAVWQREWLQGDVLEQQLSYWKRQLAGAPQVVNLPLDFPRPPAQRYQGAHLPVWLGKSLTEQLSQLCQRQGVTMYMSLLAAFQVLLSRYGGQSDVVVGTSVANRTHAETEGLIGFFINNLALRTNLEGEPTWGEVLGQVREVALGAYAHQEMPFEKLVDELQPERELSHHPLFQVMLTFLNAPKEELRFKGVELQGVGTDVGVSKFDITLFLQETEEGVGGGVEYNTDLFEAETINRLLRHYAKLLEAMVSDPEQVIVHAELLSEAERRQLLVEWNETEVDLPADQCVHWLFEEQVKRTPNAAAVVFQTQSLTFAELNRRANQLSHHLQNLGVGPEVLVGLCVERSLEMVIGLLGVLKAGGAYVPLDPAYPLDRLSFMLEDAAAPVLLTQEKLIDKLPALWIQVLCLDTDWELIAQQPDSNPLHQTSSQNLVYVIYTSGSTGRPKGAMNTHRGVVNRQLWMQQAYPLTPADKVLQLSSFSFDFSFWEILGTLSAGAQVILPEPGGQRDSVYLRNLIIEEQVTVLHFVPSMLQAFLEQEGVENCTSMRRVFSGGEALSFEVKERFFALFGAELHNQYGPTEASIDVTYWDCGKGGERRVVPIGRPNANNRIYVLDKYEQPVGIGIAGEIFIGGVSVGRGYLKRPELTAERFTPDPFSREEGARLYRTGDLGRYRADGSIEYLGRLDEQVKVRGFRIELGEVEAVLREHTQVREAVVVVREDTPGHRRLVAYVVADGLAEIDELREYLQERLPEYMVPSALAQLVELPLTPSGKVDRRALPAPERTRSETEEYAAPRTAAEQLLANIWCQVLRLPQIGIHDNFFELGGDSILSIQVISRANRAGLQLTPRQLFAHQTIATLAAVAGTASLVQAEQGLVTGEVSLTSIQHWFFERQMIDPSHFNQAVMLAVPAGLDLMLFEQSVKHLVAHHDALRLRFAATAGGGWQQWNAEAEDHPVLEVRRIQPETSAEYQQAFYEAATEVQRSLDLEQGPLVRVAYFDLGEQQSGRVLIVIHHLAVDGVSWRILLEDLRTAYEQLSRAEVVKLPAKTSSYQQWARRLVEYAESEELHPEIAYWTGTRWQKSRPLPVDTEGSENSLESLGKVSVALDAEQTRALVQEVPQVYHTQINDLLLTALALAFRNWSGEKRLLIDLEGHGREDLFAEVDVSRTVGWFTTIFPVLLEVSEPENGDQPLGAALKAVKEELRGLPNKGLGYGLLRYLNRTEGLAESLKAQPRAEVSFNYLGQVDQELDEQQFFGAAQEPSGPWQNLQGQRAYLLEINAIIAGGQLRLTWSYSRNLHRQETIEELAADYIRQLQALIAHCQSPGAGGYTPSDFPLARVTQAWLDDAARQGWEIEDVYGLSPLQQGLLFHAMYAPEGGEYVVQLGYKVDGRLQTQTLKSAWQQVIERHEVLRSSIHWEELETPVQVVHREVELVLEQHDWRGLNETEQQQKIEEHLRADRRRGFDLQQAPLMRVQLARTGAESYWFTLSFHHLLLDGWSMPRVLKEVFRLYEAASRGEPARLEASRPYVDYIRWLSRQDMAAAAGYWRQRLAGFNEPTPLPLRRSAEGTDEGYASIEMRLSEVVTTELLQYSRQQQVTLNTVVQGAWAILLWRYSGERDLVYGTTVSGRPSELFGVEEIVGLFINTLPVRVEVRAEQELGEWLRQIQTEQVEMRQYEYSPLVDVQKWSEVGSGRALFESIVVFENYPLETVFDDQAEMERPVDSVDQESVQISDVQSVEWNNYPITVIGSPGRKLRVTITYDRGRVEEATIIRLAEHYQRLLAGIIAEGRRLLGQVEMLSESERQQIVYDWNQTQQVYPDELCIAQLFEVEVERRPEAVALICGEQRLSYGELNRRANQLAHHLRQAGVSSEVRVGICLERSVEMIVGLLAILKAGGVYVPLDESYPLSRLSLMMEDAEVLMILTRDAQADHLPAGQAQLIILEEQWPEIAHHSEHNLESQMSLGNLAYITYTSGSMGRPKGVCIPQRGVRRLVRSPNYVELSGEESILQLAPLAFDASTFEIWGSLLNGGRLVMMGIEQPTLAEIGRMISEQQVTTMWLTAGLFHLMVDEQLESLGGVRQLLAGGDVLSVAQVERLRARWPECVVINGYGPTENTTFTACHRVGVDEELWSSVPIGRAITNTQVYVVDGEMEVAPVGVVGELYTGGEGLARGYVRDAALTAARFVPDPFSGEEGSRLYRTGDVVRYLRDGRLEYVGRRDEQVKVRGYRIELGEVEAVLREHSAVREAVVIVRQDIPGDKRLVAYVVTEAETGAEISAAELREFVKMRLPDYMAPSAIVQLPEIPLTANGKVDRRALPSPEHLSSAGREYVAPRTTAEQVLAKIWSEVLRVERVSIEDNFFELGGDSILTIQIISRASRAGLQLTPRQLFEHQTIASLAAVAGSAVLTEAEQGIVTGEVFLTPIEHWFFEQDLIDAHHFNQAVMIAVAGGLDLTALEQAVNHLVAHHDALRLRFQASELGWRQSNAGAEEHRVFEVRKIEGESREELWEQLTEAATEIQRSLDLERGPLVRVAYFDLGEGEARVLLAIHHLAVDGVSWRILLEDLGTAYEQLSRGAAVELPAKTTSYQQWARRLVEYAGSEQVEEEINYWTDERWEQANPLRVDSEGGENSRESLGTVTVVLGREQTRALVQEVPQVYHTQTNDVLLTALGQALGKWSGTERVLIDLEGHGREDIFDGVDVSRTVGWFTTIYPVLLEVSGKGDHPEAAALKSVKEQLRAVPRRGIGYGVLRYLSSDASVAARLKALPQAKVSFNYREYGEQGLSKSGFWTIAEQGSGATESESAQRAYLLEIDATIADSELRLTWSYSRNLHCQETIEELAANYLGELEQLISHCQSPGAGGYTPSDFPLARLTQEWLDQANQDGWQIEDIYGLSPLQQGMFFHSLYAPDESQYLLQLSYQLRGELNLDALERAWQQVVERHDLLRSSFHWDDLPEPVQVVHRKAKFPFARHDWRGLSAEHQEAELQKYLLMDRERGFDFAIPPLMRLATARIEDHGYWIIWTYHHMLLDGWSLPRLIKEVFRLYEAESRGQKLQMEASRPYAGYIRWLRQQNMADAEAYWRNRLSGFREPTPLPLTLGTGSAVAESGYAEQRRELSKGATQQLQDFSRQQQVTINTVLQAAWALLLWRYSGESDLVYGTTVSGRPAGLAGVEEMIGLFINTLPVRVEVKGQQRISEWLRQLQTDQVEMRQYEYSPLMEIQRWSEVARGQALFESVIVFENFPLETVFEQDVERQMQDTQADSVEITDLRSRGWTNFPLTLIGMPGGGLSLTIGYDRRRFAAGQVETIANSYERLLAEIVRDPAQQLWHIQLLTRSERQQIIFQWNQTERIYPAASSLSQLVEAQAERTPEATAVSFDGQELSYGELNRRSNQLAHCLRKRGVGPEVLVGICMERSLEMVIGVLGVLKAGGAYVPLDPQYPQERLSFTIKDAQMAVLLTQASLTELLPACGAEVIQVDHDWQTIASESELTPPSEVTPANLAYVIYTSGSTGVPKGVAIEHQSTTTMIHWAQETFAPSALRGVLASTSLCFDLSVFEVFVPLSSGGTVLMVENALALPDLGAREAVTLINTVPSAMAELVRQGALPTSVEVVNLAGEALSRGLVEAVYEQLPEGAVYNLYGPSEDTTYSTATLVARGEARAPAIGRPIANSQAYVLDQSGELAPVGVTGELYLGGAGLARGYWERAELTAERFIPDPFSVVPGQRLYRTGDLVRYLADGELEYLGRLDQQVKVRGYRIELGEIEAVLSQHPEVRDVVVVAREDVPGQKQLVAYVVNEGEPGVSAGELRSYLRKHLPEHMLPAFFVTLEELPLTPNGKVDRRALPVAQGRRSETEEYVAPRTAAEQTLVDIWSEVLRVERIGIHDNFFELGGQSLLAMQVISRVRKAFQIELPVYPLFVNPTVAGLAAAVAQTQLDQKDHPAGVISKVDPIDENYLLDHLDELSEAEVDLLLKGMIEADLDK